MKKIILLSVLFLLNCSTTNILADTSMDSEFSSNNFKDVFIAVQSYGFKSQDEYFQNFINDLNIAFKARGVESAGFVYDDTVINAKEILNEKIAINNSKYLFYMYHYNDQVILVIKDIEQDKEVWKSYVINPFVGRKKLAEKIIKRLESDKVLK